MLQLRLLFLFFPLFLCATTKMTFWQLKELSQTMKNSESKELFHQWQGKKIAIKGFVVQGDDQKYYLASRPNVKKLLY